jgi:hypothetical protein
VSGHIAPSVPFLSGAMVVSGLGLAGKRCPFPFFPSPA